MAGVILTLILGFLVAKVWQRRERKTVSDAWLIDQQRREFAEGIDLPCISWSAMRELARERGVIS